jgi:hypothetical protein
VYIAAVSGTEGLDPPSRTVEKPPVMGPERAARVAQEGERPASLDADLSASPTPFRALLAATLTHSDAALGLACAYAELSAAERGQLLDAVIADAEVDALSLSPLLGPLCAIENDPALSERLRKLLETHGVALRMSNEPPRILLSGDSNRGAALLVRPIDASDVDVLELRWDAASALLHTERKRAPASEVPAMTMVLRDVLARSSRATLPEIEQVPIDLAAEVIAHALWRYRRVHGVLPVALNDFADLIGPHNARSRAL